MLTSPTNENNESESYQTGDVASLMKAISIDEEMLFDEIDEKKLIIAIIEDIFVKDLKTESKIFLEDKMKINNMMVLLINNCYKKHKYKKVSKIFIEYCDYFDLPYNRVYTTLHEKIQKLIKYGFINMIGKNNFNFLEKKYNPNKSNILSLFDMVNKK